MADCGFCNAFSVNDDQLPEVEISKEDTVKASLSKLSDNLTPRAKGGESPPPKSSSPTPALDLAPSGGIMQEAREPPSEVEAAKQTEDAVVEKKDDASPKEEEAIAETTPDKPTDVVVEKERDFDSNPTDVYVALQRKEWERAAESIEKYPDEVSTWISRKESDGRLRWRLLPIHGAIVFNAPESIVSRILEIYPDGAKAKDDQGMVPLHLSLRVNSPEKIIGLLLAACPESIEIKDRKGRTPKALAMATKSPKKENFLRALEKFQKGEEPEPPKDPMELMKEQHEQLVESMKKESAEKQEEMEGKINELQAELDKTQETSQVLVDHITSLESQLTTRSDTEKFLASKIATLDSDLKSSSKNRDDIVVQYQEKIRMLNVEKEHMEVQNRTASLEKEADILKLETSIAQQKKEYTELLELNESQKKVTTLLEAERKQLKENVASLEEQIAAGATTQRALADQITGLANTLNQTRTDNAVHTDDLKLQVKNLKEEKANLFVTVTELTKKVETMTDVIQSLADEQKAVVESVSTQAKGSEVNSKSHTCLLQQFKDQELSLLRARDERDKIAAALVFQMEHIERITTSRATALEATNLSSQQLEKTTEMRNDLINRVKDSTGTALATLEKTRVGMPANIDFTLEEKELVPDIVNSILRKKAAEAEAGEEKKEEEPSITV